MICKFKVALVAIFLTGISTGCGSPGAPGPPSLNLPITVSNLSAIRIGDSVRLSWTMPTRTTDRVTLKHPIAAEVCRGVDNLPCANVVEVMLAPGAAGSYQDQLPSDLTQGSNRLLHYAVLLRNHAGKSAGPSNLVYSAAGPGPATLTGLSGQIGKEGVLLSWRPGATAEPGKPIVFRIERRLLTPVAREEAPHSPLAPALPAVDQTLAVHSREGVDPGHALDHSALFNQQYRYIVERVVTLSLAGQSVEIQGLPSDALTVSTKITFPPAVPQGLAAVSDTAEGAIDLSWSPNLDSELAAYRIYRRDTQESLPAQRIASVSVETSFRDAGAQRGHTYAYSVSAIDQGGNESNPSPEVQETLPAQ